jgi:hypothetical protein
MIRRSTRSAIVAVVHPRSPDVLVEELAHRRRADESVERLRRQFAIVIVTALDADDQGALRLVVADALDQAAAVDIAAVERPEVDGAAVPDVNRLGAERGRQQERDDACCRSDHDVARCQVRGQPVPICILRRLSAKPVDAMLIGM